MDFITEYMNVIVAGVALVVLFVALLMAWRSLSTRIAGRRGQRLGISEYQEIDKSRRLVLVRRDNVEHLIMIGGVQDLVIEPNITPADIADAYTHAPVTPEQGGYRAAQRPPTFGERRPHLRAAGDPEF